MGIITKRDRDPPPAICYQNFNFNTIFEATQPRTERLLSSRFEPTRSRYTQLHNYLLLLTSQTEGQRQAFGPAHKASLQTSPPEIKHTAG